MSTNSFDEKAATWDDDPARTERARGVADAIRAVIPLEPDARLLEYGSGTGLVSQALQDSVGPITVADSSRGMLDVLRAKVASGALRNAQVRDLNLSRDPAPDDRFDVIVTVMVLHHIPDVDPVLRGFAALLEDGGRLCVADLDHEDGSFHDDDFEGHSGFHRDELAARLRGAGFRDIGFTTCWQVEKNGRTYDLFLATATRDRAARPGSR